MIFSSFGQTCRLRQGGRELVLIGDSGSVPSACQLIESGTESGAVRFLRELCRDPRNLRELEKLANGSLLGRSAASGGEAATVEFVARKWACGEYKLYGAPGPAGPGVSEEQKDVEKAAPVYNTIREKSFFSVRLVADASDESISGVKLIAEFPNGSKKEATTDRGGRIDIDFDGYGPATLTSSIKGAKRDEALVYVRTAATPSHNAKDLGDADLNGKPLVSILEYRVRTGNTFDGIAKGYGMTNDDLALFNFGTTDADEVDKRLCSEVGARRNPTTKRVELSSDSKPGIIYVPKPLRLLGMSLDRLHIVRISKATGRRVLPSY